MIGGCSRLADGYALGAEQSDNVARGGWSASALRSPNGAGEIGEPRMNDVQRQNYRRTEAALAWRAEVGTSRGEGQGARFEGGEGGTGGWITGEATGGWAGWGAFEWVTIGYLTASSALIAVFAVNLAHPARMVGTQILVTALILTLCRTEARARESARRNGLQGSAKWWHFWRHWYPHLFFLFCFEELGKLVHLVTPRWQDAKLIAIDQSLTGVNPSLWMERFAHPALNEFMQFAYFTYFVYLLILFGIFYSRRSLKIYSPLLTYSAVGYAFGYVISMLFPVQSPWFTLSGLWHGDLTGGPFTALINFIEQCGRVHGATFPSQHVAGAMAALWGAWRRRRLCLSGFPPVF